jgi:hypothetical protein
MKALISGQLLILREKPIQARGDRPASTAIVADLLVMDADSGKYQVQEVTVSPSSIRPDLDQKVFAYVETSAWAMGNKSGMSVRDGFLFVDPGEAFAAAFGPGAVLATRKVS